MHSLRMSQIDAVLVQGIFYDSSKCGINMDQQVDEGDMGDSKTTPTDSKIWRLQDGPRTSQN